jgi:protoporphyrinogen oxidase
MVGMILIAGAGLAGLSAAYHLAGRDYRLLEKETRPGGLCRSEKAGPYTFDYGGHLLHLRGKDIKVLVRELVGDRLILHQRRAAIFSHYVFTPYPFQVNTHGLPPQVVRECVLGFVEALLAAPQRSRPARNFQQWVQDYFGDGFARHFFEPFNRKFFKRPLSELTSEWAEWSIPRPRLSDVISGALGLRDREFGYNTEFFYPAGGIEVLPQALAGRLSRPVETGAELVEILPAEKRAHLANGETIKFNRMIATIPLDQLLGMCWGLPAELRRAARGLKIMSVLCVNLGVKARLHTDQHWIYLPEERFSFHRVGLYSNYMKISAGRSALYLEVTLPGPVFESRAAGVVEGLEQALVDLKGIPLWKGGASRIEQIMGLVIPHGYVIYDRHRAQWLPRIIRYLRDRGIELAGRYGRWEYATMEDALRQGREAAAWCRADGRRR